MGIFGGSGDAGSAMTMILIWVVAIGGMYLLLLRPQSKRRKQEEKMRNDLRIGDEVTTIGGVVGRIVSIKDDSGSLIIESGIDRNKMQIKRWAVASCDTVHEDTEK